MTHRFYLNDDWLFTEQFEDSLAAPEYPENTLHGMIRQFFVTNVKAGRCTPGLVCSRTALGQFSARLRRLSGEARR